MQVGQAELVEWCARMYRAFCPDCQDGQQVTKSGREDQTSNIDAVEDGTRTRTRYSKKVRKCGASSSPQQPTRPREASQQAVKAMKCLVKEV